MNRVFGLETEYGITVSGAENVDVVAESIELVRRYTDHGAHMKWDYELEDPHLDARGFRAKRLMQDTDESAYYEIDKNRPLSFEEIKSDLVLSNGARFYNDHAHPEYSTPECTTLRQIVTQDNTPTPGQVQVQDVRSWQIERAFETSLSYPLSRVQRFELSAGYRNIDFSGEIETLTYSSDGFLIDDTTGPSADEAVPSISLFTGSAAAVYDNSIFGGTSPVAGQRYRLEVAPLFGDLQFTTVLGDYRRYVRLAGPLGLAGRLVHIGRYGRDSESERIAPLFVGYPWLVRGYDAESFRPEECQTGDCQEFSRLFGSRIGVANVELRLPLLGAIGLVRSPGIPPVEAAGFYDAGVAWTNTEDARFLGGPRVPVSSFGTTLRVNLLGFAVAEIAYVHPNDRPLKGWYWQFNLQPGF